MSPMHDITRGRSPRRRSDGAAAPLGGLALLAAFGAVSASASGQSPPVGAAPAAVPAPTNAPAPAPAGPRASAGAGATMPASTASPAPGPTPIQPATAPVSVALGALPDEPGLPPDAVIRTNASLMAIALSRPSRFEKEPVAPGTIEAMSLFAVRSAEERHFSRHDLVQIVVREQSRAKSDSELDTKKDYTLAAEVAWANFSFDAFGQPGVATTSGSHDAPVFEAVGRKKLKGEGDYSRNDEFTTRMTAEVIEVLPNGNLVLEARTTISSDKEMTCIKLTGMCRPEDITSANTVLSNQIHDLKIEKMNTGFVKDAADKGILAQVLDAIFAF